MSDHESDAEERQELDLSKVSTEAGQFGLSFDLSLSLTFVYSPTWSPSTKPRLKSPTVCVLARFLPVRMHGTPAYVFRAGVLSSVIQACKPDAKIAQLCEQGDKLIQEYVMLHAVTSGPVLLKVCTPPVQGSEQRIQGEKHRERSRFPNLHLS